MFIRTIAFAIVMAGLIFTPQAGAVEWVTAASACVADPGSAGRYHLELGRAEFSGNNTESIFFRCNVTNPRDFAQPLWNRMEVTYEDPDGFLSNSEVVVTLYRVDKFSGLTFQAGNARFSSNDFVSGQHNTSISFAHNFNFVNNAYYIGISIRRTQATLTPRIQRVRLWQTAPG
jgi:hypothetical protein